MYYRQRYRWTVLNIRTIHFQGLDSVLDLFTREKKYEGGLVILGGDGERGEPVVVMGPTEDSSVVMCCALSYLGDSRTRR